MVNIFGTTAAPPLGEPLVSPLRALLVLVGTGARMLVEPQGPPWSVATNPRAGITEAHWARTNPHRLAAYAGSWVAVHGNDVVATNASLSHVLGSLKSAGISDALVFKVPQRKRPPLIA